MNKGLEALRELKKRYGKNFSLQDDARTHIIEKELKALEIIIKKNVCIHDLKKSKTLKEYNGCREYEEELTEEEYELLKEVLL